MQSSLVLINQELVGIYLKFFESEELDESLVVAKIATSNPIPHLGNECFKRIYDKRLCDGVVTHCA